MLTTARLGLSFIVGVATFYFVFWVPFSLLSSLPGHWLLALVGSFAAAVWTARYTWRRTDGAAEGGALALALSGALIVGGTGFVLGFFGPMIFAPGANQGPLLGLFITGPLGFVAGGVGGLLYGLVRRKPTSKGPGARAAGSERRVAGGTSRTATGRSRADAAGP